LETRVLHRWQRGAAARVVGKRRSVGEMILVALLHFSGCLMRIRWQPENRESEINRQ
jgi:hypothetical protein